MSQAQVKENTTPTDYFWYGQNVSDCFSSLGTTERGLSSVEVVKRLKRYGENNLPGPKPISLFQIFADQFRSPLIYILLISAFIILFLGEITDTVVVFAVLIINAVIGVIQEGKAQNTLLALRKFTKTEAVVLRDDVEEVVGDKEIVPGDVIILREGEKVPADARLFEIKNLHIDEAALTGESLPVSKTTDVLTKKIANPADQHNMIFRGSLVVSGTARAVVVSTGLETVIGKISKRIVAIDTDTPFKKNLEGLSRYIGIGVLLVSVGVFALGILIGNSVFAMFFTAVAVAVSLVPEGLPVVITLVLATGAYRMAKQNALVKKLGAVEALGQATVIAVDKTGTITKNELMVEQVYVGEKTYSVTGSGYEMRGDVILDNAVIDPANHPELLFAGKVAAFCANARVNFLEKEGIWKVSGDPTEAALLVFGDKIGFHKDEIEQEEPLIGELPFDSKLKYHATIHRVKKKPFLCAVGAPEAILALSNKIWQNSRTRKITEKDRNEIEMTVQKMSREALRVIAFAYIPNYDGTLGAAPVEGAAFVGLFGMRDVLREGVAESVEKARQSGLQVVMITGDHKVTAEAIAREAGIYREGDFIITDKELTTTPKEELVKMLSKTSVFARISPEHKLDIIELFRKRGDIVAMTGDGVNDALSLVAADLGIAMGKIGTEVSKEAADIVLLDDNFKSIILAIEEGRNIYHCIKRVLLYLFSTGLGELFSIVGAMIFLLPPPVFPTQILWLNLVTDGFLVVSLAFEPKEKLSNKVIRGGNKFFFDKHTLIRAIIMGMAMAIVTILVFRHILDVDSAKAYTMSLTVLATFQWWNAWNIRSDKESIFSPQIFSNPYLLISTFVVIILQLFAIYNPVLQKLLHTTALSVSELGIAVLISLSIIFIEEIRKLVYRIRNGVK